MQLLGAAVASIIIFSNAFAAPLPPPTPSTKFFFNNDIQALGHGSGGDSQSQTASGLRIVDMTPRPWIIKSEAERKRRMKADERALIKRQKTEKKRLKAQAEIESLRQFGDPNDPKTKKARKSARMSESRYRVLDLKRIARMPPIGAAIIAEPSRDSDSPPRQSGALKVHELLNQ